SSTRSWRERGCHPERRRREGSLLGRRQWERDGDPSARPWSGADVDSGVVRVHDPARDREAEARAVRLAPRRLTAIEALEHMREVFGRDADPGVQHDDRGPTLVVVLDTGGRDTTRL